MYEDATSQEIDQVMEQAVQAGKIYGKVPLSKRKALMNAIAAGLEKNSSDLVKTAMKETNLSGDRLKGEVARTVLQLRQYGKACAQGIWMNIRIDTPGYENVKTDLRKMQIPIGPVVVFGSSNFPFAYSTAGGDTACALAAGCPVIVKAHPAHAQTSQQVADLILEAIRENGLPRGVFSHVHGTSFEVGEYLVKHDKTKAVGFTGSLSGGRALYDLAAERQTPIPVFAEMGSTNPVFLLSHKLHTDFEKIADDYAVSVTNDAGQFCTKPGIIVGIRSEALEKFKSAIREKIKKTVSQKMLHPGIASSYRKLTREAMAQSGVEQVATTEIGNGIEEGKPLISTVSGADFIKNTVLHQEVFGPFSLIVECGDYQEMQQVAESIDGKLTATVIGNEEEVRDAAGLVDVLREMCGRLILNGVPTGVTVSWAMHHGGPYPATTDSRFTSVGSDGIVRFTRPVCYQNWPDNLLPDELRNANPLKIWRLVNGELTPGEIQ